MVSIKITHCKKAIEHVNAKMRPNVRIRVILGYLQKSLMLMLMLFLLGLRISNFNACTTIISRAESYPGN